MKQLPHVENARQLGTCVHVGHVQLHTRLPFFSACNIIKLGGARGRGYPIPLSKHTHCTVTAAG